MSLDRAKPTKITERASTYVDISVGGIIIVTVIRPVIKEARASVGRRQRVGGRLRRGGGERDQEGGCDEQEGGWKSDWHVEEMIRYKVAVIV
jgi:hypothetical protein